MSDSSSSQRRTIEQQVEQIEAEAMMVKHFIHHAGTDPDAWIDSVLDRCSTLLASLRAEDLNAAIAAHLRAHPEQHTTRQIAEAVGISPNHALKVAANVAHQHRHGKHPSTWTLKKHITVATTKA